MSPTFFDRNQNTQIHGDVNLNIFSSGGSTRNDPTFLHVDQPLQTTNALSRAAFERGFKLLCDNTAPSALYGSGESFEGPRCHPGTRIAVQDYIFKWLNNDGSQIAMWMNGPVGIGKSAIAQTIAHQAAERGQLSSAFFFFRSDNSRNTAERLVPTLAYEMTQRIPHTLDLVCQTVGANPLLFSATLDLQISSAVLHALCTPIEPSPRRRMLIIIDGLDECLGTNTQQGIIRSFIQGFLRVADETIPHKILIVSRPESHIASAVSAADINPHFKYLALESWNTEDDIGIFLSSELIGIQQTHPLRHYLPGVWPGYASFRELRQRSVGSFAYASVVIRYLASHNNNPENALQDVLSLRPSRAVVAFADLDALYRHILLSLDETMRFILQKVLCLYIYSACNELDALAARLSEDKSMVELVLLRVSSLIHIRKSPQSFTFHHTSFQEFLRDKERSGDLYVFSPDVAGAVAQALSSLWLHPLSDVAEYRWFDHLSIVMSDSHPIQVPRRKPDTDMYVHIINTLVATKIPASFLHPFAQSLQGWDEFWSTCKSVAFFIKVLLKQRSKLDLNSTYRSLFEDAYNVICAWLRSHFNLFFQNDPTPNDVLDILLEDSRNKTWIAPMTYPFWWFLSELEGQELFYCIMRVFPDIDRGEIFSCILERRLALPSYAHMPDIESARWWTALTVPMLYTLVLNLGGQIQSFCQKLEQIILMGQQALGGVPSEYVTPRDCIFRFFYGDECYIDSEYQLTVKNQKVSDIIQSPHGLWWSYGVEPCFRVAERTDRYIRRAHTEQDFAYISEDVSNLYRTASPKFLEDWEREMFWDNDAVEL